MLQYIWQCGEGGRGIGVPIFFESSARQWDPLLDILVVEEDMSEEESVVCEGSDRSAMGGVGMSSPLPRVGEPLFKVWNWLSHAVIFTRLLLYSHWMTCLMYDIVHSFCLVLA
jgi:hypothetical protein